MAKLIFTSRYLKDAKPSQKENYVHYIGTRKGVEKIDTSKKHLPATVSQKKLVHQLLQDFPATKEMLEYEDYQSDAKKLCGLSGASSPCRKDW